MSNDLIRRYVARSLPIVATMALGAPAAYAVDFQSDSGDFSGSVHIGYKVEHGKLVGRVKDTAVAGNIFADMKELGGISNVAEWVGGRVKTPHILFSELGVSTKSGG